MQNTFKRLLSSLDSKLTQNAKNKIFLIIEKGKKYHLGNTKPNRKIPK